MVHVYTFERLNNIPSKDDIKDVLNNYVSDLMTELIVHNKTRGAIVYGSVPRDEHSETSDLDVLVRYISTDVLPRLRDTKIKVLEERGVIIEFSTFIDELAMTPFHRESFSYLDHIRANLEEKIIFGENPMDNFVEPFHIKRDDNRAIYAMEMGKLFDMVVRRYLRAYDDQSWYKYFLTGCLEKPVHFVREAVQLLNNGLPQDNNGKKIDKNCELIDIFLQTFPKESKIGSRLCYLIETAKSYKRYIKSVKYGEIKPTAENHQSQLRNIEDSFFVLHEFMIETARELSKRYFSEEIREQLI